MKRLYIFGILLLVFSHAVGAEIKEPVSQKSHVAKCIKPGAPVQIPYTSEPIDVGAVGKVDIVLTTQVVEGTMKVVVKTDKGLDEVTGLEKPLFFELGKNDTKEYPLQVEVSSSQDGLYYVKLIVSIKGHGMRAFAVPVYVGDGVSKAEKKPVEKTSSGEAISVSAAQESIEE
ncbi:MAG TPA: hypothetical protein PLC57_07380 [Sulfurovum sp.]|nr:hypothetical protein [Sulfurovum sp.]